MLNLLVLGQQKLRMNRTSNLSGIHNPSRRGPTPSLSISSSPSVSSNSTAPPIGPTPHVKQTISVEEWERRAPLSDLQVRTVAKIAKASEHVPLPLKVSCFVQICYLIPLQIPVVKRLFEILVS